MDKISVDEDWYTLDSVKQVQHIEHIRKRQDEIWTKLEKMETMISSILQRMDFSEQKHHKETLLINNALHELHTIKEREINLMIRERIPFPFGIPKLQTTPHGTVFRKHFSTKKEEQI